MKKITHLPVPDDRIEQTLEQSLEKVWLKNHAQLQDPALLSAVEQQIKKLKESAEIEIRHEYGQIAFTLAEYVKEVLQTQRLNPPLKVAQALQRMDLARGKGGYKWPER